MFRRSFPPIRLVLICGLLACSPFPAVAADATIRHVTLLPGSSIEVEIAASQPIHPQAQMITGPDRLVLDFPGSLPASDLHNLVVNRGEVKSIRIGLFAKNPPVTRVVVDLKQPQTYQLFPSGNTVIVKLGSGAAMAEKTPAPAVNAAAVSAPPPPVQDKVEVRYENGLLSIWANRASLAEVLKEIQKKTGADVPVPPGAEQDLVVTSLGPGPAREVLASLLDGSNFNFIVVGRDGDPSKLTSVILTPRGQTVAQPTITYTQPAVAQAAPASDADAEETGPSSPQPESQPPPQPEQPPAKDDSAPPPQ